MKMMKLLIGGGLLVLGVMPVPAQQPADETVAAAATAWALTHAGNEHFAAGRYDEALAAYEAAAKAASAGVEAAVPPALLHDLAAAHYKRGAYDEARALWTRAKGLGDASFEARMRYNLGNCDYAQALAAAQEQDGQQALDRLQDAIGTYREALRLDPSLADARANLELAHRLRQELKQQQQEQEQQQSESCDNESQDPNDQQSERQQDQQQQQDQQKQESSDPNQAPPQEQEQQEQGQQDESQQQQQQEQGEQSEESESGEQDEQQGDQSDARQQPAGAGEQSEEDGEAAQALPPIEMTRAEAERLLQMIRDAEKQRREALARQQAAQHKPAERDW